MMGPVGKGIGVLLALGSVAAFRTPDPAALPSAGGTPIEDAPGVLALSAAREDDGIAVEKPTLAATPVNEFCVGAAVGVVELTRGMATAAGPEAPRLRATLVTGGAAAPDPRGAAPAATEFAVGVAGLPAAD